MPLIAALIQHQTTKSMLKTVLNIVYECMDFDILSLLRKTRVCDTITTQQILELIAHHSWFVKQTKPQIEPKPNPKSNQNQTRTTVFELHDIDPYQMQ